MLFLHLLLLPKLVKSTLESLHLEATCDSQVFQSQIFQTRLGKPVKEQHFGKVSTPDKHIRVVNIW